METDFLLTSEVKSLGSVELLTGNDAVIQLLDDEFLKDWDDLYHSCPWGTVFQSKEFALTWYQTYQKNYLPLVVKAHNGGSLTGILTLAKAYHSSTIICAGGGYAEYHTWLTHEKHSDEFIQHAISLVRKQFPNAVIEFKFIPANTPFQWIRANRQWTFNRVIREHDQPIVAVDEAYFLKKLNAKTIKEKIKRLKRQGDLQLERITQRTAFAGIINELLLQFDFRKGALYNRFPSREDPLFKNFLLNLFDKNVLHVTVLKLNEKIIASMINTEGKNWVFLKGINTHAPCFARQSPGLLHFLMLGKLLSDEKVEVFDLTPGGDYYKEGLATGHATVHQLWLVNDMKSYLRITLAEFVKKVVRETVSRKGIDPRVFLKKSRKAKETLLFYQKQGLSSLIKRIMSRRTTDSGLLAYPIRPESTFRKTINRNSLKDLLEFDQQGSEKTQWTFLEDAMKRFEFGEQSFTVTRNGKLLACAWLKGRMAMPGTRPCPELPEEAVILQNLYCHKDFEGSFTSFLSTIAAQILRDKNGTEAFAVADPMDTAFQRIVSKPKSNS